MNETGDAILIVDDSKEDVELVVGALRKHLPGVTTLVARPNFHGVNRRRSSRCACLRFFLCS